MRSLRVAVLGGGPAGLCAARLIKRRQPAWDVVLYERNSPELTYGYGVGLGWSALKRLGAADPGTAQAIEDAGCTADTWTVRRGEETVSAVNHHGVGISRTRMLQILSRQAEAAGVSMHTGRALSADELTGDVIVAADGVGSETRRSLANDLGASTTVGELAYMWCGSDLQLRAEMVLALALTPAGPVAAHMMPYGPQGCTFQVDAHQDSLADWGLSSAPGEEATLSFLSEQFAGVLGGAKLQTKRSDWATFATVTCDRWSSGNTVLLGDAVHTAHYSVGSGTGLAVDDAIVLSQALAGSGSRHDAFAAYEAARKPDVARIQGRAECSQRWWTTLKVRAQLPMAQLMLSYLTRTGALTLAFVAETNPDLVATCLAANSLPAGDLAGHILAQPLCTHETPRTSRIVPAPSSAAHADPIPTLTVDSPPFLAADVRQHVERAERMVAAGATCVRLIGSDGRDAVLGRLDVAEQIRAHTRLSTIVRGPTSARDDLALGVLSDRTDLVEFAS